MLYYIAEYPHSNSNEGKVLWDTVSTTVAGAEIKLAAILYKKMWDDPRDYEIVDSNLQVVV